VKAAARILSLLALLSAGDRSGFAADPASRVALLYAQQRWQEVVDAVPPGSEHSADLDYYRGMALARLERWADAEDAFKTGRRKAPRDKRFPLELAGVAFKRKDLSRAREEIQTALRLDPEDAYANDFLATLYVLDENLPAALKYWNRIQKPHIENLRIEPQLQVNPVLLDRAFAFSPASLLLREDFWTTEARLRELDIFPRFRFELLPAGGSNFDLLFRPVERNGWGDGALGGLLSLLRGMPYQTITPEFYNLQRSAVNVTSLFRWDAQKRRVLAMFSAPLHGKPAWRYQAYVDGRKENWDLSRTFHLGATPLSGLNLQRIEAGAVVQSAVNGKFAWQTDVNLTDREFRSAVLPLSLLSPVFTGGLSLGYRAGVDYNILRLSEHRLTLDSTGSWQFGRLFAPSFHAFSKLQGSVDFHWYPRPRGEDYEMTAHYRAGKTFGPVPFDELFILGIERDNDLWLHGHIGTQDGKKGSAPLGRDYLLLNWEIDKALYVNSLVTVKAGPLLDGGRIYGESQGFGSERWLVDPGAQCKIGILGAVRLVISYGKDLRSGRNAFYTMVTPTGGQKK
jgi:tetratricopeptide (TPR) repeat protein